MIRTASDAAPDEAEIRTPSVLAVLVCRNGAGWLKECLQGLSSQTYPRFGVLAVDSNSTDRSRELLERALGAGRVLVLEEDLGVPGAVSRVLEVPAAREADYLLVVHDDSALAPDAVERLVEAASGIRGLRDVGIVGPKVVDWDDPRMLREVGGSTDRFGHPYSPLQEGEMDHGQYERVLEVMYVPSSAMLVGRDVWQRTGLPDERLSGRHEDLDYCWRARLAGFRVVMTPLAQVRHRATGPFHEQADRSARHTQNYFAERAALTSMLKNYSVLSLLWLMPLYVVLGLFRLALLLLTRRFEDGFELLAAWGWTLRHLPGTFRRRVRAQAVRTVPDRNIRRFMESASVRLPRWFDAAGRALLQGDAVDMDAVDDDETALPTVPRTRIASVVRVHPVFSGGIVAILVGAFAVRHLIGPEVLTGGVIPAFPHAPSDFFRELLSGVRTTALGGTQSASPALAVLGGTSAALFASTGLAQKVILCALPPMAGVMMFRSVARRTGSRGAAVLASASYVLCALMLQGFSDGRIDLLVTLVVVPVLMDRVGLSFAATGPQAVWRFVVGTGLALAFGVAFAPGVLLAFVLLVLAHLLVAPARLRGVAIAVGSVAVGALLLFPLVPDLVGNLGAIVGRPDFAHLSRLVIGPGVSAWAVAWFLPVAALIGFGVSAADDRPATTAAMLVAVAGLFLAWGSAAGWLPRVLTGAPSYLASAATAMAVLVGYGVTSFAGGIGRESFGYRQIAAGAMTFVLTVGLVSQAVVAGIGDWAVGPAMLPAAWPLVSQEARGGRVLWIGPPDGLPLPPPAGDAQGVVAAGSGSVAFAIDTASGSTALDIGRGERGPGYEYLQRALNEIIGGTTVHGGSLMAPLGVKYLVGPGGTIPPATAAALDRQLDLVRIPALGLDIWRNTRALPVASSVAGSTVSKGVRSAGQLAVAELGAVDTTSLDPVPGGWAGRGLSGKGGGAALIGEQYAGGWRLRSRAGTAAPTEAFGWAIGFPLRADPGPFTIVYSTQWLRTTEMILLGLLWLAALWITRKPASS